MEEKEYELVPILNHGDMILSKGVVPHQICLVQHTEDLSELLNRKFRNLEDYGMGIDEQTLRLAEVTAQFYSLLVKSSDIRAVVKDILSEGHQR